jgi:hypothetical protein
MKETVVLANIDYWAVPHFSKVMLDRVSTSNNMRANRAFSYCERHQKAYTVSTRSG